MHNQKNLHAKRELEWFFIHMRNNENDLSSTLKKTPETELEETCEAELSNGSGIFLYLAKILGLN